MYNNLVLNWINEFGEVSKLPLYFPSIVILDVFISSAQYLCGRWQKVVSVKQDNLMTEWVAQGISPLTFPCDLKCSFTSRAEFSLGRMCLVIFLFVKYWSTSCLFYLFIFFSFCHSINWNIFKWHFSTPAVQSSLWYWVIVIESTRESWPHLWRFFLNHIQVGYEHGYF